MLILTGLTISICSTKVICDIFNSIDNYLDSYVEYLYIMIEYHSGNN